VEFEDLRFLGVDFFAQTGNLTAKNLTLILQFIVGFVQLGVSAL
jgi:hypothetical protein